MFLTSKDLFPSKSAPRRCRVHLKIQVPLFFKEFLPAASGLNQASPGISPGTAASQLSHHQSRSKLPKLVLPKFRGDATKFHTFWDTFESAIDKNPGLSKIDKFLTI